MISIRTNKETLLPLVYIVIITLTLYPKAVSESGKMNQ